MNFDFDYFCGAQYAITYLYVIFVKRNILIQIFLKIWYVYLTILSSWVVNFFLQNDYRISYSKYFCLGAISISQD